MEIRITVTPLYAEYLRKAVAQSRSMYNIVSLEKPTADNRIEFLLETDNPESFFHAGKNFGIISEFNSFDHRERKHPEE